MMVGSVLIEAGRILFELGFEQFLPSSSFHSERSKQSIANSITILQQVTKVLYILKHMKIESVFIDAGRILLELGLERFSSLSCHSENNKNKNE